MAEPRTQGEAISNIYLQTHAQRIQLAQQMAMAEREQRAANLDALLSLGSTLLTSPTEGTALGNIMSKGNTRLKNFGGRLRGLRRRGRNQTGVTSEMGIA